MEEGNGRKPNGRTHTNSIPDGRMLTEGCLTEGHKPKLHLTEERYGRTPNPRTHTNIPDGRTLMEGLQTKDHVPKVHLTEEH